MHFVNVFSRYVSIRIWAATKRQQSIEFSFKASFTSSDNRLQQTPTSTTTCKANAIVSVLVIERDVMYAE